MRVLWVLKFTSAVRRPDVEGSGGREVGQGRWKAQTEDVWARATRARVREVK